MPWWQMRISLHFPDTKQVSTICPTPCQMNIHLTGIPISLHFCFICMFMYCSFLEQFSDTFQGKTPLWEQQFLKTWVQIGVWDRIKENTEKQVFSRILPDVQNKFIHGKGKHVFMENPYIIHPVTKIFKCFRQPQSELLLIFQLNAPKANHSYS